MGSKLQKRKIFSQKILELVWYVYYIYIQVLMPILHSINNTINILEIFLTS